MRYQIIASFRDYEVIEPIDWSRERMKERDRRNRKRKRKREEEVSAWAYSIGFLAIAIFLCAHYFIFGY